MPPLLRHQLLRLSADGWAQILRREGDAGAGRCFEFWAERDLPLVVTRQSEALGCSIAVGLPAPAAFGRRRFALAVEARHVASFDEFPSGDAVDGLLANDQRVAWRALRRALADLRCEPRVYGGHGWQALTGLAYLHPGSDLDLLLPAHDAASADALCAALSGAAFANPRLDGELVFADGGAVAWREWLGWRQGRTDRVLVKRLREIALIDPALSMAGRFAC